MTIHETWDHYYEPEKKAPSRQWVGPGSPRPKEFKIQPSAGKVMATEFWDAKALLCQIFYPREVQQLECTMQTVKNAEVNSLKVFCCNRTMRQFILEKLQWVL